MSTEISVAVRRAVIETNLERCRDRAAQNLVEIGRWLNAAKEEGVVPHGRWTAWVQEHAGMNERTAQRCMQAARELPEGSPLELLGLSKIRALLTLPEGEREQAARDMGAENLSSREVESRVQALRKERDEALRLVGEQKRLRQKQEEEVNRLDGLLRNASRGQANMSKLLDQSHDQAKEWRERAESKEREVITLRGLLADATQRAEERNSGTSAEAQAEIERLSALVNTLSRERERAEREIDQLTEALDEAQTAAARGSMTSEEVSSPQARILSGIGALMTQAGRAPSDLARLASPIDEEGRALLIRQAQLVGEWAMRIIAVCGGGQT